MQNVTVKPRCKCGGDLEPQVNPKSIETPVSFIIGRCLVCRRPYQFSIPMWEMLCGPLTNEQREIAECGY